MPGLLTMPSRIKLVYNNLCDFNVATLPYWSRDFEPVAHVPGTVYDPTNTMLWTDYIDDNAWCDPYRSDLKIVCNYHWDQFEDETSEIQDNVLHFRPKHYVWMFEYMTYQHRGYRDQIRHPQPNHFFLTLMNLRRDLRDHFYSVLEPYHNQSMISYVGQGRRLPGDAEQSPGQVSQRHFNPDWYARTCFSMVSETFNVDRLYVSEKSFKPLAYKHPFIIYGTLGSLKYLHDLGFETFDHVIDESYDTTPDPERRLDKILQVLDMLYKDYRQGRMPFQDAESRRRVLHNYDRFYDSNNFELMWYTDMVTPIEEFLGR